MLDIRLRLTSRHVYELMKACNTDSQYILANLLANQLIDSVSGMSRDGFNAKTSIGNGKVEIDFR